MTTSILLLLLRDCWKDLIICIIARNGVFLCFDVFDFYVFFPFLGVSVSALPCYLTAVVLAQCFM